MAAEGRDERGRFIKGHTFGKRFVKGEDSWNKGRKYKCKSYNLTEDGKKQKIKNLGKYIDKSGVGHITKKGYKKVTINGKQRGEHLHIWCSLNGFDKVPYKHDIHHIDHNKLNNNPSNLMLMSKSNHMSLHRAQTAWVGS